MLIYVRGGMAFFFKVDLIINILSSCCFLSFFKIKNGFRGKMEQIRPKKDKKYCLIKSLCCPVVFKNSYKFS